MPWLDTGVESGIGRYSVGGCNFQQVMKESLDTFDIRIPQVMMKDSLQVTLQLRDFVEILTELPQVNWTLKDLLDLDWTAPG